MARGTAIIVVACMLLGAACSSEGSDAAADAETTVPSSVVSTTTTEASTTTTATTVAETTTTVAETTTTEGPTYLKADDEDALLEQGVYRVTWSGPKYGITLAEPTMAWLLADKTTVWYHPPTVPEWHHPDATVEQDVGVTEYSFVCSYDGGVCEEVDIPEDPMAFIADHPFLDAGEPTPVTIDGHDGMQVDVVVSGVPEEGGKLRFGGFPDYNHSEWPEGAALRITVLPIGDETVWLLTMSTEEGFDQAAGYSDALIAGIEFD